MSGLSSLLKKAQGLIESGQMLELDVADLQAPGWTLRPLKEDVVIELARSIHTTGLLQPIVVRHSREGYEVVFGNHRLEACRRLGLKTVRVIVREFTEEEAFLARLSENLLRNSFVDPIEEAAGYAKLVEKGWTINSIGEMVGKCDSYICERMALLARLSKELQKEVSRGLIAASHAELISRIRDPVQQKEVAQLVRKKKLSVKALENLLNGLPSPTRAQVLVKEDEYYIRIPKEFADVISLKAEGQFFIYLQGRRKLVIENLEPLSKQAKRMKDPTLEESSHVRTRLGTTISPPPNSTRKEARASTERLTLLI